MNTRMKPITFLGAGVEVFGRSVSLGEAEVYWRIFLQRPTNRELHGVEIIISDAMAI